MATMFGLGPPELGRAVGPGPQSSGSARASSRHFLMSVTLPQTR
ncbi:hypothetical protein LEMLEM_LOCUS22953 [Lemmus lemmus]